MSETFRASVVRRRKLRVENSDHIYLMLRAHEKRPGVEVGDIFPHWHPFHYGHFGRDCPELTVLNEGDSVMVSRSPFEPPVVLGLTFDLNSILRKSDRINAPATQQRAGNTTRGRVLRTEIIRGYNGSKKEFGDYVFVAVQTFDPAASLPANSVIMHHFAADDRAVTNCLINNGDAVVARLKQLDDRVVVEKLTLQLPGLHNE